MNHQRMSPDGTYYSLPNKHLAKRFDECLAEGIEADYDWAEKYLLLPDPAIKISKRELTKKKARLTYQISNIRADYSTISKEDIPEEVTNELCELMSELKAVKELLAG